MKKYLLLIALLFGTQTALLSQSLQNQNTMETYVKVTGKGTVEVVPDKALVTLSVENEGKDANEVKNLNDTAVSKVLSKAKSLGIASKDIQTTYVNLNKNYDYNNKRYNYRANQTIKVTIKDLTNFDKIMNGLLDSGINRISGVDLQSSDIKELSSQARKKAVENAKMKANEYASALGQKIGKALQISEEVETIDRPYPMVRSARMMSMDAEDGSSGPTLAPGEMSVESTIYITFALQQ